MNTGRWICHGQSFPVLSPGPAKGRADPGAQSPLGGLPAFWGLLVTLLSGDVAANDQNPDGFGLGADMGTAAAKGVAAGGLCAVPATSVGWGEPLDVGASLRSWHRAGGCSRLGPVWRVTLLPLVAGKYWVVEGEAWGKGAFLEKSVSQGCDEAHK